MSVDLAPPEDPRDRRLARRATGLLHDHNVAGVLTAADIHVAERLGRLGQEDDQRVLLAAALAVRAVRSGSVCLELDRAPEIAPGLPWPEADRWAEALAGSPLVGSALRFEDGLLYLDRYWREETEVVQALEARAAAPPPPSAGEQRLQQALEAYFPGKGFTDQRRAAETACRRWTTVMTGGPGTGKTTTVARLLGVLMAQSAEPLRVALAAPTGKAAARMAQAVREATRQPGFPGSGGRDGGGGDHGGGDGAVERAQRVRDLEATTLHRLLGSRPDNRTRFRHHRGNRLPHDVVVVDETSMVSLSLMARLLEAVRPEARLVLVGDADQLASVEAGAVLKDLVEGYAAVDEAAVSRLTTTRRFGRSIGALAEAVRRGDTDEVLARLEAGEDGVRRAELDELPELLGSHALALAAAAETGDRAGALRRFDEHRLLCAHREGPYGVGHWNRRVERLLMDATGRDWLPEWYAGRPLTVNSNDYGLGLFNGDTGVVCAGPEGGVVAAIGDGGSAVDGGAGKELSTTRLADVSTAHAMTVHRSQGSQFAEVTVLLPEPESRILTRELFYTAVTRARSVVRVVGGEESIRAAVERRAQRATGLARRLGS
jgi:exodeoxyribonuclease V alpha subunit